MTHGANGVCPGTASACLDHSARLGNVEETLAMHATDSRALGDRVSAHDEMLGRVLTELGAARSASDRASAQVDIVLARVQEMAEDVRGNMSRWHDVLAARVAKLESPMRRRDDPRPALPSNLDLDQLTPSTIEALPPDVVILMRELANVRDQASADRDKLTTQLHAAREEALAASTALTTRERQSERAAAIDRSEAEREQAKAAHELAKWKLLARIAVAIAGAVSAAAAAAAAFGG